MFLLLACFQTETDQTLPVDTGESETEDGTQETSGDTSGETGAETSGDTAQDSTPPADPCRDAYERILARYKECGIVVTDDGYDTGDPCSPEEAVQSQCTAACVELASCGVLDGTDTDYTGKAWSAYVACATKCY